MKKIIYLLLCVFPMLLSCNNEKESDELTEYYVRYEYDFTYDYNSGRNIPKWKFSFKTVDGTIIDIISKNNQFNETIGPVRKGFEANISVSWMEGYGSGITNLKIYVAKGNEPFALKEISNSTTASYTIDF